MNFKQLAFIAVAVSLGTANAQTLVDRVKRDEIAHMSSEEPAMRSAFEKARASLDTFLAQAKSPAPGTDRYALKVAISDGQNTEYFWVVDFSGDGKQFTGVLNNEPRLVMKHRYGEKIAFRRDQIADWTYMDAPQRRMHGNFTACALLTKEPPAQAAEFKRQYGLRCD
ncbi:YegJ family protein [Hydrogenophaga luteola]|uniref:YegJ family protein n=1 Tax=Hydrogenophaga luteola TaxID=1591122 RepID=A0ABV7W1S7_9BURK